MIFTFLRNACNKTEIRISTEKLRTGQWEYSWGTRTARISMSMIVICERNVMLCFNPGEFGPNNLVNYRSVLIPAHIKQTLSLSGQ